MVQANLVGAVRGRLGENESIRMASLRCKRSNRMEIQMTPSQPAREKCPRCKGWGYYGKGLGGRTYTHCEECNGTGLKPISEQFGESQNPNPEPMGNPDPAGTSVAAGDTASAALPQEVEPTEHEIRILYENALCQIISQIEMSRPRSETLLETIHQIASAGAGHNFSRLLPHYKIGTEPL